jgi:hypothetical protein
MLQLLPAIFLLFIVACNEHKQIEAIHKSVSSSAKDTLVRPYSEVVSAVEARRKQFAREYEVAFHKDSVLDSVADYWIAAFNELYLRWKDTPWDFNGITRQPKQGTIACGYFVTTLLLDMGYKLNRVKLSTCASLTMMKSLVPGQRVANLSYLSYADFYKKIKDAGRCIYITGLDFHTGFLINDGTETWFLHSNYIGRQGVIKEKIAESVALRASKSRFVVSLTNDSSFLSRWMSIK